MVWGAGSGVGADLHESAALSVAHRRGRTSGVVAVRAMKEKKPAKRWGVWCEPTKRNKVGLPGWLPDRDYDTGRRGWTHEEASRQRYVQAHSEMRLHWAYSVRELPQSEWQW